MSTPPPPPPGPEAFQALCQRFRDTRHDINNAFAVLLALAELGQRNPANYERLGKAVLERCPQVLHELQLFQEQMFALLDGPADRDGQPLD
jgi:hypothetical protein